jgi:predicted nucleic acid-binding protein
VSIVLDSSVALTWFLRDELPERELRTRIAVEGAVAPILWQWEVANALLMSERRGRLSSADRSAAFSELRGLPIEIDEDSFTHAWTGTFTLALAHRLTIYDAAYLELAQRRGLPLASLDRALRTGAAAARIAVLP